MAGRAPADGLKPTEAVRGSRTAPESTTVGPKDRPSAAERGAPEAPKPPEPEPLAPERPGKPPATRNGKTPEPAAKAVPVPPVDTELKEVADIVEAAVAKGRPPGSFSIDARNATNIAKVPRNSGDAAVRGRPAPEAKYPVGRTIASEAEQNAAADRVVQALEEHGFQVKRVNQTQVGRIGRIGQNRPDIQVYSKKGRFFHVEIDGAGSARGLPHAERILNNDPDAGVILVQFLR